MNCFGIEVDYRYLHTEKNMLLFFKIIIIINFQWVSQEVFCRNVGHRFFGSGMEDNLY